MSVFDAKQLNMVDEDQEKKNILPESDETPMGPSEKLAREEIRKLTQNTEEIRKLKEQAEKDQKDEGED